MSQSIFAGRSAREEVFGWMKGIGGLRKTRFVGRAKVEAQCVFAAAAYNLVRMRSGGAAHVDGCGCGMAMSEIGQIPST